MILSGHQPVYLPGIILFNKIALSDAFMFVGHCQYTPKSWHSRNYIAGQSKPLTVPVHKGPSINETMVAGHHWCGKHLKSIELAYSRYPFFDEYFHIFQTLLTNRYETLGQLNMALIIVLMNYLGLGSKKLITDSSKITGRKTDMLISMCKAAGADEYLSNEGSRDYVDEELLAANGIKHRWQKFKDPDYGQKRLVIDGKEQPLSVLDLLFSKGPEAGKIVRGAGYVD